MPWTDITGKKLGKQRIIAETAPGSTGGDRSCQRPHGVGMCYLHGEEDIKRQKLNVFRMRLMGAEVRPVSSGSRTLKDAINEAFRDWVSNIQNTHYLIGSVVGPHLIPRWCGTSRQSSGRKPENRCYRNTKRLPDYVVPASAAVVIRWYFLSILNDKKVRLSGWRPPDVDWKPANMRNFNGRSLGVLHGAKSYVLQIKTAKILETHSISAGLDYPGVGPEHSYLKGQRAGNLM